MKINIVVFLVLFGGIQLSSMTAAAQGIQELCTISGAAGSLVQCPLILASANSALLPPSALEYRISWDSSQAKMRPFGYEWCYQGTCYPLTFPDCNDSGCTWGPLASGHTISHAPLDFSEWQRLGSGAMIIVNSADPTVPVTHAYLDQNGALVGNDAIALTVNFELLADISAGSPVSVQMTDVAFSSAEALAMAFTFIPLPMGRAFVVFVPGDTDNNGTIELADVILALKVISGDNQTVPIYRGKDLNGNETIGMEEVIYSLQKVAKVR